MTQEEKSLLLQDLCARLCYGVKISKVVEDYVSEPKTPKSINVDGCIVIENEPFDDGTPDTDYWDISEIKPYLRPMSSMSKDEREEVEVLIFGEWYGQDASKVDREGWIEILSNYDVSGIYPGFCGDYVDWLNAHHFDYRGLIEKGLALKAPEDIYIL